MTASRAVTNVPGVRLRCNDTTNDGNVSLLATGERTRNARSTTALSPSLVSVAKGTRSLTAIVNDAGGSRCARGSIPPECIGGDANGHSFNSNASSSDKSIRAGDSESV